MREPYRFPSANKNQLLNCMSHYFAHVPVLGNCYSLLQLTSLLKITSSEKEPRLSQTLDNANDLLDLDQLFPNAHERDS